MDEIRSSAGGRRSVCDTCIEWGGKRWHRYNGGYYERTDKSVQPKRTVRLHRAVWEHHNGVVPDGWHVHHDNEDKGDNGIDNLRCMPAGDHTHTHGVLKRDRSTWHKPEPFTVVCADCGTSITRRARLSAYTCKRCQQIRADRKRETWRCCQHCADPFRSRAGNFCSQRCVNLATNGATVRVLPEGRGRT